MGPSTTALLSFEDQFTKAQRGQGLFPGTSIEMCQIRWRSWGVLADCIEIAQDAKDPESTCRPYIMDDKTDAIADVPATEPPLSSITAHLSDLDMDEDVWEEEHLEHADDDDLSVRLAELPPDEYGRPWTRLVQCCYEQRPAKGPTLTVAPSSKPYVTIGDYINQVHPWLQTLKSRVFVAKNRLNGRPLPADTTFGVAVFNLAHLGLYEEVSRVGPDFLKLRKATAEYLRMRESGEPRPRLPFFPSKGVRVQGGGQKTRTT
ncbi:hypothetical protein ANO11243_092040 [Dothideomycetidae sp. 11243]|nr:hypothetical protein ANO11243_092040 [fungal sp. No.11243]